MFVASKCTARSKRGRGGYELCVTGPTCLRGGATPDGGPRSPPTSPARLRAPEPGGDIRPTRLRQSATTATRTESTTRSELHAELSNDASAPAKGAAQRESEIRVASLRHPLEYMLVVPAQQRGIRPVLAPSGQRDRLTFHRRPDLRGGAARPSRPTTVGGPPAADLRRRSGCGRAPVPVGGLIENGRE